MDSKGYNRRIPWGLALRQSRVEVVEGTVAELTAEGVCDLMAVEDDGVRPIPGRMQRQSVRVLTDGSDEFGTVNVPRRKGDGFKEYKVYGRVQRYTLKDGSEGVAVSRRSDRWAKERSPEVGFARLARLMMDKADALSDNAPARGLEPCTLPNVESPYVERPMSDAQMWIRCTTEYNNRTYVYELQAETGAVRGFGIEH